MDLEVFLTPSIPPSRLPVKPHCLLQSIPPLIFPSCRRLFALSGICYFGIGNKSWEANHTSRIFWATFSCQHSPCASKGTACNWKSRGRWCSCPPPVMFPDQQLRTLCLRGFQESHFLSGVVAQGVNPWHGSSGKGANEPWVSVGPSGNVVGKTSGIKVKRERT